MQALASQLQNARMQSNTPTNGMDSPDRLKTNLDSRCNALTYLKASLTDHTKAVHTIFDFMEPERKSRHFFIPLVAYFKSCMHYVKLELLITRIKLKAD